MTSKELKKIKKRWKTGFIDKTEVDSIFDALDAAVNYEYECEKSAKILQQVLPISKVKAIGLREVATGVQELANSFEFKSKVLDNIIQAWTKYDSAKNIDSRIPDLLFEIRTALKDYAS